MYRIAFVTTCKNRLPHLQQTLPQWVAEAPDEIVVVDYGCPQGTGDWVEANWPQVKVVRVTDDPGFCLSRARNLGAAATDADWICFIDADIRVQRGWTEWMRTNLQQGHFYRPERLPGRASGTVIVQKQAFDAVFGYDICFRGWGGEDTDFYHRLKCSGWRQARYPVRFAVPIPHDDEERFTYAAAVDRLAQLSTNALYLDAKRAALALGAAVGEVPEEMRSQWRNMIESAVGDWREPDAVALPEITYTLDRFEWLEASCSGWGRCEVTIGVMRRTGNARSSLTERVLRRWHHVRARLSGIPRDPLRAIEPAIKARVRPFVTGQRAVPAGGLRFSVAGEGARLPDPYCVFIRCHFDLSAES